MLEIYSNYGLCYWCGYYGNKITRCWRSIYVTGRKKIRGNYKKNEKKTKFMTSRKPYNQSEYVTHGTYNFETEKDCTYLGTVLTNEIELGIEI